MLVGVVLGEGGMALLPRVETPVIAHYHEMCLRFVRSLEYLTKEFPHVAVDIIQRRNPVSGGVAERAGRQEVEVPPRIACVDSIVFFFGRS